MVSDKDLILAATSGLFNNLCESEIMKVLDLKVLNQVKTMLLSLYVMFGLNDHTTLFQLVAS